MSSVNQAAYVPGSTTYEFGYNSIPNIPITGAPADANLRRWAMLHDGSAYRLYCFKGSSRDTLYQFAWNGSSYAYGHNSIPELTLTNIPADADLSSFSMVHSGSLYHLYLRRLGDPTTLYQFLYVQGTTTYNYGQAPAIPTMQIAGFPADTDWSRWMMLHDNSAYRFYAFKLGSNTQFYQGSWDGSKYSFGHNSIRELTLKGTPANSNLGGAAMLHDNSAYRFYLQTT
ncbi:hypothetical protein PPSIR1_15905 [Plesiocystis pacifica SIR-1]|uniref:Uncharacterized protein n=1 Tax=Plesiocystis pacifica SIR-1 TaxID=391625 RepID=A6GAQ9_9BACT|nr:hypothetical protein [Plesiocystis pacifica]EDM77000.1 hypothetical protein PPSIR1_15905 [Plesiocystis pacifica SIR-1]